MVKVKWFKNEFENLLPKEKDICLLGLGGSRGFGINGKNSDYDYYGIFVEPKESFLGMSLPKETIDIGSSEENQADIVLYELGHFFRLAIKCNPTIINILFFPRYNILTNIGKEIVENRDLFLFQSAILSAYGGFVSHKISQFKRTVITEENKDRIKKDIFYCFLMIDLGIELLETGSVTIPLKNYDKYYELSEITDKEELLKRFEYENGRMLSCQSGLPDKVDIDKVNNFLIGLRKKYH